MCLRHAIVQKLGLDEVFICGSRGALVWKKTSKKLGDSFALNLECNSKSLFKFPPPSLPQHLPLKVGDNSDIAREISSVRNG